MSKHWTGDDVLEMARAFQIPCVLNAAAELDVFGALFAVNMLVHTPVGDTFTLEELTEDLQSAGFTNIKLLHPDPQMNAVVQARKQG
ncbi:MAG: hypothetical protein HN350_17245 [Phycisphaerales bacterium]|jgi:hypothetical protein|nr:hypothetical protein [Phycisphaerales bacterium]